MSFIVDRFATEATGLRAVFDARFRDPRNAGAGRFVWDYWHVPGQYTAVRTPAWTYFPPRIYRAFHTRLVMWGRRVLGCHDISPPWLSCYVDGCEQRLHGDLPHGPWAFVFSLTPWKKRKFTGGETLLLRDEVLDFWDGFESIRSVEEPHIVRAIEPLFGRLVVFDPRIPHGVRTVRGTHDPRDGRLVIHGWFVSPRPFIEGPLSRSKLASRIASLERDLPAILRDAPLMAGLLSLGFSVGANGRVTRSKILSDTTRVPRALDRSRDRVIARIRRAIEVLDFGKQRGASKVTLPLSFER